MCEPGSPTQHLLPLVDLAGKVIQPTGLGLTILPTSSSVGEMDHWTWEALRVVLSAWSDHERTET